MWGGIWDARATGRTVFLLRWRPVDFCCFHQPLTTHAGRGPRVFRIKLSSNQSSQGKSTTPTRPASPFLDGVRNQSPVQFGVGMAQPQDARCRQRGRFSHMGDGRHRDLQMSLLHDMRGCRTVPPSGQALGQLLSAVSNPRATEAEDLRAADTWLM